jgi:hypothetical protein
MDQRQAKYLGISNDCNLNHICGSITNFRCTLSSTDNNFHYHDRIIEPTVPVTRSLVFNPRYVTEILIACFHEGCGSQTLRNSMLKMAMTSHSTRVQWQRGRSLRPAHGRECRTEKLTQAKRKQEVETLPRVPPTEDRWVQPHGRKRAVVCCRPPLRNPCMSSM